MSFGWSAGDIVASLQLLNKAIIALKDIGGASSDYQHVISFLSLLAVTLQHLKALQSAPLNLDLSKNLEQHCTAVQEPLKSFLERIHARYDKDLGGDKTRPKILTAVSKLQWAFSTSKEVKTLERKIGGHIGAIGLVLSQQVIQTTLQMPSEIQARIADMIDAAVERRINHLTLNVQNEVMALSVAEKASSKQFEEALRDVGRQNTTEIQTQSQNFSLDLEKKFQNLSTYQQTLTARLSTIEDQSRTVLDTLRTHSIESHQEFRVIQEKVSNLSSRQSQSVNMSKNARSALRRHNSLSQPQALTLHKKFNHAICLMGTLKKRMVDFSGAQQPTSLGVSNSEIREAIGSLQRSVCLLVSALHVLIRELLYLAPFIVAIYRTSIQPLLLYGDHFLFEDAIGRRKWLPCLQFQHWENFYGLLVDSFQGTSGLNRVLNGQFVVLNSYNEVPIHKRMWRSGIQPKSRIHMAIIVESIAAGKNKCATPSCPGQIDFGKNEITGQWYCSRVCGKHISILKDVLMDDEEFTPDTSFSFDFFSQVKIPVFTSPFDSGSIKSTERSKSPTATFKSGVGKVMRNPLAGTDKEIAMFKRVVWQNIDE
ncbi:Ankyrin repeat-containing protein [Rutstroemia sp. NJR-2017a WRK4]|nr:Ankyrin repeat-containing protein [Rutstroemia sp. NJR-2017a WRK4]